MLNTSHPLVSIGIPFFNAEKFINYAIESVLMQSYTHLELLLIDDGSTDRSLQIAKQYAKTDSRIQLLYDGHNHGLPVRLNQLSSKAKGKYYARMDADDIMHPDRIKMQLNYLLNNPQVDLVGSSLISIDNHNRILGIRGLDDKIKYGVEDILKGQWSVHPTIMGKTVWFKNNPYDTKLKRAQDFDLWLRTIEVSKFGKLKTPLLFYREASTPTLKKYLVSTQNAIKVYWKNLSIIGFKRCLKMTVRKISKLIVYIIIDSFGLTEKIIKRRSQSLPIEKLEDYKRIISGIRPSFNSLG